MAFKDMKFDKVVLDSFVQIACFNRTTGEVEALLDQIKDGNIENTSNQVKSTGLMGVVLNTLNRDKETKFTATNGYISMNTMGIQTGSGVEVASEDNVFIVPHYQFIEVGEDNTIVLEDTPVGKVGAEIPFIYKATSDLTQGDKYAIGATASAETFSLDVTTKTITLPTGVFEKGDIVIVWYDREAKAGKKITNKSDTFSGTYKVIITALVHEVCDSNTLYLTKIAIPNAAIDGNFTIAVGGEPAVHNFAATAQTDVCSLDKELWSWMVVGE